MKNELSRREFIARVSAAGFGALAMSATNAWGLDAITNPLAVYPNRDWERLYRDIFRHDRTFTFLCAPNDTHNCLLKGFVKNNVLVRIEPTGTVTSRWKRPPARRHATATIGWS